MRRRATGGWPATSSPATATRCSTTQPGPVCFTAIDDVQRAGLELAPPALKTAPRGLPRDHPRVALLRYKDAIAGRRLAPGPALATRQALEHVAATWRSARPLTAWLDANVGPQRP